MGKKVILWEVNSKKNYDNAIKEKVYAIETDYPNLKFE